VLSSSACLDRLGLSLPWRRRSFSLFASRLRRMGLESYRIVREEVNIQAMVRAFVLALRVVSGS